MVHQAHLLPSENIILIWSTSTGHYAQFLWQKLIRYTICIHDHKFTFLNSIMALIIFKTVPYFPFMVPTLGTFCTHIGQKPSNNLYHAYIFLILSTSAMLQEAWHWHKIGSRNRKKV
jgi:hypothetical protein